MSGILMHIDSQHMPATRCQRKEASSASSAAASFFDMVRTLPFRVTLVRLPSSSSSSREA